MNPTIMPSWLVLLPPVVTIIIAILTKRAALSLLIGIVLSSIIFTQTINATTLYSIGYHFLSVFFLDGHIRLDNLCVLGFLCILGTLINLLMDLGSTELMADKLNNLVNSRTKGQFVICILGIIFFIDDFFKCIALGVISQPLADKKAISREKLAYYLDSTAGPLCILIPISSWGAVIISIMNNTIIELDMKGFNNGMDLFLNSVVYNFYAMLAVFFTFIVALTGFNFKLMSKFEQKALNNSNNKNYTLNQLPLKKINTTLTKDEINSKINCFILSISTLTAVTIGSMILSGYLLSPKNDLSIVSILSNMLMGQSLMFGGVCALLTTFLFNPLSVANLKTYSVKGFITMKPAIYILLLAWTLSSSISALRVGDYISELIAISNISHSVLPLVIFLIACATSFSTGTSWGTFSVLIPIVCQILVKEDPKLISIAIGAVLGGAVFGDHCSPISSTSILSATGAGCKHMDHVLSQLPYCLLAAICASVMYVVLSYF